MLRHRQVTAGKTAVLVGMMHADLLQHITSYLITSTYVPTRKECENGQNFSGEAKPSWDKTVGGVLTSVLNRYRLGHTPVLQDRLFLYLSPLYRPKAAGLNVQSSQRNALTTSREERCLQKKRIIEKMRIPKLEGGVI